MIRFRCRFSLAKALAEPRFHVALHWLCQGRSLTEETVYGWVGSDLRVLHPLACLALLDSKHIRIPHPVKESRQ